MAVELSREQAAVVDQAIRVGVIRSAEDIVAAGVAVIRQRLEVDRPRPSLLSADDWSKELEAWAASHASAAPVLSDEAVDRESIYGARDLSMAAATE